MSPAKLLGGRMMAGRRDKTSGMVTARAPTRTRTVRRSVLIDLPQLSIEPVDFMAELIQRFPILADSSLVDIRLIDAADTAERRDRSKPTDLPSLAAGVDTRISAILFDYEVLESMHEDTSSSGSSGTRPAHHRKAINGSDSVSHTRDHTVVSNASSFSTAPGITPTSTPTTSTTGKDKRNRRRYYTGVSESMNNETSKRGTLRNWES